MSNPDPFALTTSQTANALLRTEDGQQMAVFPQALSTLIAATGPTFVFRPGGVAGGNVYTTWASMMAAVAKVQGPKFVQIDDSLATANVAPGLWNVDGCTFTAEAEGGSSTLVFPDNASSLTFNAIYLVGNIIFLSNSSTPIVSVTAVASVLLAESAIESTAAGSFFDVPSGGTLFLEGVATLGDGTHAAVTTHAGGAAVGVFYGASDLSANLFAGAVAAILTITSDVTLSLTQTTSPTVLLASLATQTSYTPGAPAHWNPAPTVVGGAGPNVAALDQIVSPNVDSIVNGAPISPFSTLSTTGPGIARIRAGVFVVTGTVSGTDSTTETVTITLVRDGATVVGPTLKVPAAPTTGGVPTFGGTITWIDVIANTADHTWSINAIGASGGTLSVATGGAAVSVAEA